MKINHQILLRPSPLIKTSIFILCLAAQPSHSLELGFELTVLSVHFLDSEEAEFPNNPISQNMDAEPTFLEESYDSDGCCGCDEGEAEFGWNVLFCLACFSEEERRVIR